MINVTGEKLIFFLTNIEQQGNKMGMKLECFTRDKTKKKNRGA